MEATSVDNNFVTATEDNGPVFLFGPDIVDGQTAAGVHCQIVELCIKLCFHSYVFW